MGAKAKSKRVPRRPGLNVRQLAFARAYFVGPTSGNATQSAKAAGYNGTDHVLSVTGADLLDHPGVQAELTRLRKLAESETVADAAQTLLLLSKAQRGEVEVPLGVHAGRVVFGPMKGADRIQAARLRAQMLGELRESVDVVHSGPAGGPILVQHIPPAVARAELLAVMTASLGAEEAERAVRKMLGEPEPIAALVSDAKEVP